MINTEFWIAKSMTVEAVRSREQWKERIIAKLMEGGTRIEQIQVKDLPKHRTLICVNHAPVAGWQLETNLAR
jgi:hypothetical protein